MSREIPHSFKVGQKYPALYMNTLERVYF